MKEVCIISRKNFLSFGVILLLIVLLSGISFVPAIYIEATVEQPQPQPQQQQTQQPN
jgi:hypothetical protein